MTKAGEEARTHSFLENDWRTAAFFFAGQASFVLFNKSYDEKFDECYSISFHIQLPPLKKLLRTHEFYQSVFLFS